MEPNADKPKAPVLKNPNANEDLKSLSLEEVEEKIGILSGWPY